MVIISDFIKEPFKTAAYSTGAFDLYFKGLKIGILDIETTGLSPERACFILGGLISYEDKSFEQYFADNLAEEKDVLEKFISRLRHLDVIVTYNGQRFDLPFLLKRAKILGIPMDFSLPYNLDLYLVLNNHSDLRKFLPNLKQKTVETFMGLWEMRLDEISGEESVALYLEYLKGTNPDSKTQILLHNKDDVNQLSRLLPVIEKLDFHKSMHHLGFPVQISGREEGWLKVDKILLNKRELSVSGVQGNHPIDYTRYGNLAMDFQVRFIKSDGSFQLSIPIQSHQDTLYLDMRKSLTDFSPLGKYGFFEKDFLILKADKKINHMEINHFIKLFLNNIEE